MCRLTMVFRTYSLPASIDIVRVVGDLQASDTVMNDTFSLGVYPGLTPAMIDYVLESIEVFFKG